MPRLTRKLFVDLGLWMVAFGVLTGLAFPFVSHALGMRAEHTLRPHFFVACVLAGVLVGAMNYVLARTVIRPRLRLLVCQMRRVTAGVRRATYRGDWSECGPEECVVPVDSADDLGDSARAYNELVDAVRRSYEVQRALAAFSQAVAPDGGVRETASQGLEVLLRQSGAEAGAVLVARDGALETLACVGVQDGPSLRESAPVQRALKTGRQQLLTLDPEAPGVRIQGVLGPFAPTLVAAIPLRVNADPIGVAVLASRLPFAADAFGLLDLFGGVFALALQNGLAQERLERLAAIDSLTGAYCRREGLARLRQAFEAAREAGTALGVVVIDLDHFKAVNDTHGHTMGDRVLSRVAGTIREALRDGDLIARYGGEEFLVVLPRATPGDCRAIGERLREAVRQVVVRSGDRSVRVTVSVGAVSYPDAVAADEQHLIRLADEAMYAAKQAGRDRVEVVGLPAGAAPSVRTLRA